MARHRTYPISFKRQVAQEFLSGEVSLHGLAKRHDVCRHSRLPVGRRDVDRAAGVVEVKEVLASLTGDGQPDLAAFMRMPPVVHDSADLFDALQILRESPLDMAFVVDEYGMLEGIVTAVDILEAITGHFSTSGEEEPDAVRRPDGSWLLAGMKSVDSMTELLQVTLPTPRDYHTVAGFVLDQLHRIPRTGDCFTYAVWRFEVVDMDGRRIDRVLAEIQQHTP